VNLSIEKGLTTAKKNFRPVNHDGW